MQDTKLHNLSSNIEVCSWHRWPLPRANFAAKAKRHTHARRRQVSVRAVAEKEATEIEKSGVEPLQQVRHLFPQLGYQEATRFMFG